MVPKGWQRATAIVRSPEAFWAKVDKSGDCWTWCGARRISGYGYLQAGAVYDAAGKRHIHWALAHRLSWEMAHGETVPPGMVVCHRCDYPPCVRPEHLFLGTRGDNNRDKERKGRGGQLRGEAKPNARLTMKDAVRIRREYASGAATQQELADRYGVAQPTISKIILLKIWVRV